MLLGLLALSSLACGGGVNLPEIEAGSSSSSSPRSAPTGESAAEIMGLNEPLSVPPKMVTSQRLDNTQIQAHLAEDAVLAEGLGMRWGRGHNANTPWLHYEDFKGFDQADMVVKLAQEHGFQYVFVIGPWEGNKTGAFTDAYVLPDSAGYAAWVQSVVERYDGDGVDDMPGLEVPVKHWEVDNEPDLKNSLEARGAKQKYDPRTFCTASEYLKVLELTAKSVRAADPEAKVLNGGFYRPHANQGKAYMDQVMRQDPAVDILSIHAYFDGPGTEVLERALANAAEVAGGRPIWLTETSVASQGQAHQNEAWHAEMVVRLYGIAMMAGIERVFWHSIMDAPKPPKGLGMAHHSLMQARPEGPPREKLAATAYRNLAALLAPVARSEVRVEGGRLLLGDHELVLEGKIDSGVIVATGKQVRAGHDARDGAVWRPLGGR